MSAPEAAPARGRRADRAERFDRGPSPFDERSLLGLGYVVVAVVLATIAAWPVYGSPRMVLVAAVGLVLGLGLAVVARLLRWRGVVGALLVTAFAVVGYALVVVPVAIPSALGSPMRIVEGVRDGFVGVIVGWKQLLTLALPLGEYQAVLVPFLLVILLGSLFGGLFVLPDRGWSPLAVLVGFGMTAFGIVFGSSALSAPLVLGPVQVPAPRELLVGVGGLLAAVGWLLLRSRSARRIALQRATAGTVQRAGLSGWVAVRRRAVAAGLVAVALIAGAAVAPAAAELADRSALRDRIEPELAVRQAPSPLSGYRAAFTSERIDEPWLELDGETTGVERVRIATLDEFDGEMFQVAADPADPSTRFTRLPRAAGAGDAVFELTVGDGYRGLWVPAPAGLQAAPDFSGPRAVALEDGFHRSADGATAITIAPLPGATGRDAERGLTAGDRYRVVADADELRGLETLGSPATQSGIDEERYPALTAWAELQAQPRSAEGLATLVERLRARGYLSHAAGDGEAAAGWIERMGSGYAFLPSYSGHSTARIEALFTQLVDQQRLAGEQAGDAELVAGVGDDEQFATAVALLARYLGFESRVVLGFRLAGAEEVDGVERCTEVCPGGALAAWVEVRSPNGDWATVDVTPQHEVAPSFIKEGEQLPQHPTRPERPDTDTLDPPPAQSDASESEAAPAEEGGPDLALLFAVLKWTGLALAALLCLLLPVLVLLAAKRWRRAARRREPAPEVRIVGAWDELVDRYVDEGVLSGEAGTRSATARASGRPAAVALAALVERAVFAGDPPSPADADAAWAIVDQETEALRGRDGAPRRLGVMLSFASFLRTIRPARVLTEEPAR
ncbi:transglutaminase domain-containing protein [Agromyces sp. NPDC060279]|uniref:transglutaminase domain-containing protein n=1 Tax=Agromyces sp. NPDC060279 TaxID=3347092 RepID=UPI003654F491